MGIVGSRTALRWSSHLFSSLSIGTACQEPPCHTGCMELLPAGDIIWSQIAAALYVHDGASPLASCCKRMSEAVMSQWLQRVLWRNEGICWASDIHVPLLSGPALAALARWRRALPINGCFPKGLRVGDPSNWSFTSVCEFDLVNLALQSVANATHAGDPSVFRAELFLPRSALSEVLAAVRSVDKQHFDDAVQRFQNSLDVEHHCATFYLDCDAGEEGSDDDQTCLQIRCAAAEQWYMQELYVLDSFHKALAYSRWDRRDGTDAVVLDLLADHQRAHNRTWTEDWLEHVVHNSREVCVSVKTILVASPKETAPDTGVGV